MLMNVLRLVSAVAWLQLAAAQTFMSTVPVIAGNTVVVAMSTDATGGTTPVAIGTVGAAPPTSPQPAPASTTPAQTQTTPTATSSTPRVVGQPGPTGGADQPIPFTYITTGADGQPYPVTDIFTPTFNTAVVPFTPVPGSIVPFDQFTAMYGGGDSGGSGINNALRMSASFGTGAAALICVLGGVILLL